MARMSNLLEQVKSIEEGFASDAQRRAAFASGYKAKGKKGKKEEAELDEGKMKELATKIADVYIKMKKDSTMKPFADKFRADVKRSLDVRKSLEKVLPDYIGGGKITTLMKEETDIDELSLSVKDIQKSGVRKQDTSKLKKDLAKLKKGLKKEDTEIEESTKEYAKSLEKIAGDKQLKMLSKSDKEKLVKIAALLAKARKEEVEIDESMEDEFGEKFQSRRPGTDTVNKAIAIAKKMSGNMTGAVKAIEKIRDGLSKYPEVANALRMANEEFELDEKAPKIGVDRLKQQRDKDKDHADAMGRHVKSGRRKSRKEDVELDEAGSQGMFLVIQGLNDNKQKVVSMHKRKADAIKARDAWNDKNKPEKRTHKARVYAVGKFATTDGKPNTYKVGDNVMYSDFARSIVKEDIEIDEASMKIGSIDFELFDDMKGAKQANAAMNKEIAKAAKMKDYKSARTYMNKVQDKYQKFGAGDSEPERTIDAVLAKSFSNDPDRRKHSFDFRREDVEVIDGYFEEQKSSTGYDLYHKDFSGAMQHAYAHAKKKFGITIDKDEISDKVATGPSKPSKGKTNSYRLKGDKGSVQIQVYNMGSRFELNMYKEEVVEDFDPADFDIKATSKDKEQADQNILIQLQKVISLRGQKPVEFGDGKKQKVHPNVASAALSMHRKLRRTDEKDAFQRKIGKSYRDLLNAVKGK